LNNPKDISPRQLSYNIIYKFLKSNLYLKEIYNEKVNALNNNNLLQKPFIKELTTGSIRRFYEINYYINQLTDNNKKINEKVLSILLLGIYQLKYMDNVPDYAAISTSVDIAKVNTKGKHKFVNAILRKISNNSNINNIPDYFKYSFPKWFYDFLQSEYPENTLKKLLTEFNKKPKNWIRIDKKQQHVIIELEKNNIEYTQFKDNSKYLEVKSINNTIIHDFIRKGYIYVQSPSSGFIIDLLSPKSHNKILDACSAPGGKLIDIINRTSYKTTIGLEISKERFSKMLENFEKLYINTSNLKKIDFFEYNTSKFDKILLDVPCSSTGTISKNPDIRIRRKKNDFILFKSLQLKMLSHAAKLLNSNGSIIYSTCSICKCENWDVVNEFLLSNTNFKIINANNYINKKYVDSKGALNILPHIHKLDGMFAVKLKKNEINT